MRWRPWRESDAWEEREGGLTSRITRAKTPHSFSFEVDVCGLVEFLVLLFLSFRDACAGRSGAAATIGICPFSEAESTRRTTASAMAALTGIVIRAEGSRITGCGKARVGSSSEFVVVVIIVVVVKSKGTRSRLDDGWEGKQAKGNIRRSSLDRDAVHWWWRSRGCVTHVNSIRK